VFGFALVSSEVKELETIARHSPARRCRSLFVEARQPETANGGWCLAFVRGSALWLVFNPLANAPDRYSLWWPW
jgi:hypothetical protein